jgi:hypothetical protein
LITIAAPWSVVEDPGFAGPRTRLRAWSTALPAEIDDDDPRERFVAHEAVWLRGVANARVPDDTAWVPADDPAAPHRDDDDDEHAEYGRTLACVRTAPGATLGEIVDASAAQGARLDASFVFGIVAPLVAQMLAPAPQRSAFGRVDVEPAISVDHVVVGFDGASRFRGHLAWWGAAAPPAPRAGFRYAGAAWPRHAAIGALLACALTSRRRPAGLSLPNVDKAVRDDARALLERLRDAGVEPDVPAYDPWDDAPRSGARSASPAPPTDTAARVSALAARVPADPRTIGAMVRALFPARWERERTDAWRA